MTIKKQDQAKNPKHDQMLAVASRLFLEKGFVAVSMDAVAEAVPVSKRTLYNHFTDKNGLFIAVMQRRCQQLFDALEQSTQENDSIEHVLTHVGEHFLSTVLHTDAINMYRTIITKSQQFPELGKLFYDSGPKRTRSIIAQYLTKAHKQGLIKVANPELSANMFVGMLLNRIQMQCLLGQKQELSTNERDELIRYAVNVFLLGHGLAIK